MNTLHALRKTIARIECRGSSDPRAHAPLGIPALDTRLGGGLARGRLHELFAADAADASSAAGFAAMLANLVAPRNAPLVWLCEEGAGRSILLHPPGLAQIGLDPARLLMVAAPDPVELLRAAADVARCAPIGAAVVELRRQPHALDLTASRRLAMAAETSGVTLLMLRTDAEPTPSAAQTRWRIAAAPSAALEADAPGHPAFTIELLRQRGGPADGPRQVEWNGERRRFRERKPALSGAVVSAAAGGSLAAGTRAPA